MTMRLHPDEAPVLREHALPLARDALRHARRALSRAHRNGPILIEIFPRHDDFAVRNVGLPGMIGALGACFGRVVTLDSPRARPPGTFNWQATLWHELAHVITLQLSGNRIPRWLTEGISVYEEQRARPEWGRDMELRVRRGARARRGACRWPTLNAGFMDPATISHGVLRGVAPRRVPRPRPARRAGAASRWSARFADGSDTDAAMQKAMGTTLTAMEPAFYTWLHERFDPIIAARERARRRGAGRRGCPRDDARDAGRATTPATIDAAAAAGRGARGGRGRGRRLCARGNAPRTLLPAGHGDDGPARADREAGDRRAATAPRAIDALEGIARARRRQRRSRAAAGGTARRAPATARARRRRGRASPSSIRSTPRRRRCSAGRPWISATPESAARWFRAALAAGPSDRAAAHCDLAESYLATGAGAAGEAPGARGARGRADLRARAGPAARDRGREPVMRRRAADRVVVLLAAAAVIAVRRARRARRRNGVPRRRQQRRRRAAARRAAVDASCASKYHGELDRRPPLPDAVLGRAMGHRRPGRRAEPVAARAKRDRPSKSATRSCSRWRIRRSGSTRGSTSSSPATSS